MTRTLFLMAACGLLSACASDPARLPASGGPDDPAARTRPATYTSVVAGYEPIRPAAPRDWREMNRRVTPPEARP